MSTEVETIVVKYIAIEFSFQNIIQMFQVEQYLPASFKTEFSCC